MTGNIKKTNLIVFGLLAFISFDINAQQSFPFAYNFDDCSVIADCHSIGADTVTFGIPNDEYIEQLLEVIDGVIFSRSAETDRYLFPIYIKCKDKVSRVITTASALYYFYAKENDITVFEFKTKLFSMIKNNDTIEFEQLPFKVVGSLCFSEINYCEPEFLFFRQNKWAFVNHFFCKQDGISFYYYANGLNKIGAVVEQLYSWGILVSDNGSCNPFYCYITKENYPDLIKYKDECDKEKYHLWDSIFDNFIIDGGKIVKKIGHEE